MEKDELSSDDEYENEKGTSDIMVTICNSDSKEMTLIILTVNLQPTISTGTITRTKVKVKTQFYNNVTMSFS